MRKLAVPPMVFSSVPCLSCGESSPKWHKKTWSGYCRKCRYKNPNATAPTPDRKPHVLSKVCIACNERMHGATESLECKRCRSTCGMCGKARSIGAAYHSSKICLPCSRKITNNLPEAKQRLSLRMRGEKNPAWGGGTSGLAKQIRESLLYRAWRDACFVRDNWTCVSCSKRGGNLEVDHFPIPFKQLVATAERLGATQDHPSLYNVANGRTLCRPCHDRLGYRSSGTAFVRHPIHHLNTQKEI